MGTVIEFPAGMRAGSDGAQTATHGLGQVIILPVVRVERGPEGPSDFDSGAGTPATRKRRRRARS
jgi:hypothetical protein